MDDGLADLSDLSDLTNRALFSMFDCTSRSIHND